MEVILLLRGNQYAAEISAQSMAVHSECEIKLPAPEIGLILTKDGKYCEVRLKNGRYFVCDDDRDYLKSLLLKFSLEKELSNNGSITNTQKI